MTRIHSLAHVDGSAQIGAGVTIWQFASVIRGAQIGVDTVIGSCAIVDMARVGMSCRIGHGVSINPGCWIDHDVFIGPNATLCNDRWPSVGKDGFCIDWLCNRATIKVERDVSIGANAVILPGVTIGEGSLIAAGACVDRSVLHYSLFKRSGDIVPIEVRQGREQRMVEATESRQAPQGNAKSG